LLVQNCGSPLNENIWVRRRQAAAGLGVALGARSHRRAGRDAMRHKIARNEWIGNAPYGYQVSEDRKHVEPHQPEQTVLRGIRHLHRHGTSLRQITPKLNREGICTRSGGTWRYEYVSKVLRAA